MSTSSTSKHEISSPFSIIVGNFFRANQNQWIHADPDCNIAFFEVCGLPRHVFPDRKAAWSRSPSERLFGSTRLLQEDRPPTYTVKVLHLIQRSLSIVNYRRSFTTVRMIVNQNLTDRPSIITPKLITIATTVKMIAILSPRRSSC